MKREPLMTVSELCREKKISRMSNIYDWAKKIPLPPEIKLGDTNILKKRDNKKYFTRRELLEWFEIAKR